MRTIHIVRDTFTGRAAFDTAVSRAVLLRVAAGEIPETFRIFVPDRIVAFGRQDRNRPGFSEAVEQVNRLGFIPVERLAGGRAAVFTEHTLSFSWAIPDPDPKDSIHPRFSETASIVVEALSMLGIDARVGEVPGEYCPGSYSVNAGGRRKLMGIGQRLVRGAAHIGGVIVVDRPDLVNLPLESAYRHLGYDWDPATTGAVSDTVAASPAAVAGAVVSALEDRYLIDWAGVGDETLQLAARLEPEHVLAVG